ncbi:MAG: hypothetical protein GY810_01225 [Aureispira sp.]|nr:hypothetical protein [Aureispira sp.]
MGRGGLTQEDLWFQCFEKFLDSCNGVYEHSERRSIEDVHHKLFSTEETLSWRTNPRTKEITGVEHLGR